MEIVGTQFKAVHIGQNGETDRIVYFKSKKSMDSAIGKKTHRTFDPKTDSHLTTAASEQPGGGPRNPPGHGITAKKAEPGTDGTDFGFEPDPKPAKDATKKTAADWDKFYSGGEPGEKTQQPAPAPEPEAPPPPPSQLTVASQALPPQQQQILRSVSANSKRYWIGKLGAAARAPAIKALNDPATKTERTAILDAMDAFVNAETVSEQMRVVSDMLRQGAIGLDENEPKVYFDTNLTGLDQEYLSRNSSQAAKELSATIYTIAKALVEEGELDPKYQPKTYNQQHFGQKADAVGQHHEYGVAHYIQQQRKDKRTGNADDRRREEYYERRKKKYRELGGNDYKQDLLNQETAQHIIDTYVPEGAILLGAHAVGKKKREETMDPTDIVLKYKENGVIKRVNIGVKNLVAPESITLRTLGTNSGTTIGDLLGGEVGQEITSFYNRHIAPEDPLDDLEGSSSGPGDPTGNSQEDWIDDIRQGDAFSAEPDTKDPAVRTKMLFTRYMANRMHSLQRTEEGQRQLQGLWDKLHGCDKGTIMVITNSVTGHKGTRTPDSYCNPGNLVVSYSGRRITVRLEQVTPDGEEVPPDWIGSGDLSKSYLEFNFRNRGGRGQIQVLRKMNLREKGKPKIG